MTPIFTKNEGKLPAEIILYSRNLRGNDSHFDAMIVVAGKCSGTLNRNSKILDQIDFLANQGIIPKSAKDMSKILFMVR